MSVAASPRVQLLVSVRNADEAMAALDGGADIIDVKEPQRGALGMADAPTLASIMKAVAGRRPVSVALGEFLRHPQALKLPPGITYAKMGLAGVEASDDWKKPLAEKFAAAPSVRPIAVIYADALLHGIPTPPPTEVIRWANEHAAGVLIDTVAKDGKGLFDTPIGVELAARGMADFRREYAADARLIFALAGSLHGKAFSHAVELGPEVVAVRGAACPGRQRGAAVEKSLVHGLAHLIAIHNASPATNAD